MPLKIGDKFDVPNLKLEYSTFKMSDGKREPIVELQNGHCIVKAMQLSMSKRYKVRLILDMMEL